MNPNVYYVMAFQISIIIVLILLHANFFHGKDLNRLAIKIQFRVLFGLFTLVSIFIMYYFHISNMLILLLIILGLTQMYADLISLVLMFLIIIVSNFFFYGFSLMTYAYFIMLFLYTISIALSHSEKIKYITVIAFSILFLNFEMLYNQITFENVVLYNFFSISTWIGLIYFMDYFHARNRMIVEIKQKMFLDNSININNYHALLHNSSEILKHKNSEISLILIQINHLNDIQLLYGKSFGNELIKLASERLNAVIDDYGTMYRMNRETFCVVTIKEKLKMLKMKTEKIRVDFEVNDFILENNRINLSISIGAFHGSVVSKRIDDYIELAHNSLLKSNGRHKVIINDQMDVI